ncbi:hypothetical protein VP5_gp37 [Vibrio phage VP5]|uniref:hypothetical protein n=1 Tax=Vibrio phage VP5 TaxID=260827 RepID=UPI00003CEC59|nr:hypothetical protein VP5_gp37 [Vibrio phage VP5]
MASKDIRRLAAKTMSHLVAFATDVTLKYENKYKISVEFHPVYGSIWVWASVLSEIPYAHEAVKYVSLDPHSGPDGSLDWQTISFGDDMMGRAEQVMARIRLRIHQRER